MKYRFIKKCIFCSVGVLLLFLFIVSFYNKKLSFDDIANSRRKITGYVVDISINNVKGIYNKLDDCYYFSFNEELDKNVRNIKVSSISKYRFKVLDDCIYDYKDGRIIVFNNSYYSIINVKYVSTPILSILDESILDEVSVNSNEVFANSDEVFANSGEEFDSKRMVLNISTGSAYDFSNSFSYSINGEYHVRGASSLVFEKKSYKLNFDLKNSPLGLSEGKDFVLDSLYNDSSKIRNKLSSDLWNVINDDQGYNNDLDSVFAEVFINNEYIGLYCLKNSVTKNVLSLSNIGTLLKPYTDFNEFYLEQLIANRFLLENDSFLNFEIKYSNDYNASVNAFRERIVNLYMNNNSYDSIKSNFYIENYIDYQVLISIVMGVDNVSKNYYLSMCDYDDKLFITPWDMDLTFGNNWDSTIFNGESFEFNSYKNVDWLDQNIIDKNSDEINELIRKRYLLLRKNVITDDYVHDLFDQYRHDILDNDAVIRDGERWYSYDSSFNIYAVESWLIKRLNVLDEYFK